MQHLVVQTSKPAHLNANDWATNGVGRKGERGTAGLGWVTVGRGGDPPRHGTDLSPAHHPTTVSHSYGYGLLDAGAMVALAQNWTSVGPQRKCVLEILTEPR